MVHDVYRASAVNEDLGELAIGDGGGDEEGIVVREVHAYSVLDGEDDWHACPFRGEVGAEVPKCSLHERTPYGSSWIPVQRPSPQG